VVSGEGVASTKWQRTTSRGNSSKKLNVGIENVNQDQVSSTVFELAASVKITLPATFTSLQPKITLEVNDYW